MTRTHTPRRALSAALLAAAAISFTTLTPHAFGQGSVFVTSSINLGGDGPMGMVNRSSLERYSQILKLNDDQKDAAKTIHEGYTAAVRQASKDQQAAMEELRRSTDDSDDHTEFMQKMPEIQKKHREAVKKQETAFFGDLRALLTPAQEAACPKVERTRRREVGLPRGSLSGESMDLVDVVNGLKLDDKAAATLAETLDQYEIELDRQLAAREKALGQEEGWEPGKPIDVEKMQARMKASREAGALVQGVNQSYATRISGLLPEGSRSAFAEAVKKKSFPRVYRQSRFGKAVEAALKFEDLDSGQRQALQSLKDTYERDAAPLNESWANAVKDTEKSGDNGGTLSMPGGGQFKMAFSEGEEKGPLADARKARRDLDNRSMDRLKGLLSAGQRDKLPKAGSGPGPGGDMDMDDGGGDHAVVIRRGGG